MTMKIKGNKFIVFVEKFTEGVINGLNDLKKSLNGEEKIIITSNENTEGLEW